MAPYPTPPSRTTRNTSNTNNNISLQDIKHLINQTKEETIDKLQKELKLQSANLRKHTDSMCQSIKSMEETLTHFSTTISEQNTKISGLLQKIQALDSKNSHLEIRCKNLENDLLELSSSVLEEFEDRARRRKNLIISGVPERLEGSTDERATADREHVDSILEDIADVDDDAVSKCHRIGRYMTGKVRLLRVVLKDEETKQSILVKAKQLRNTPSYRNIYVNPDLTTIQRNADKMLREELKRRKNEGHDVIIRRNKIVARKGNFQ